MAKNTTSCENFLQTPLLVLGFIVLVISLAGFIGACFHVAWALWVYLVVMLFTIMALIALTVFGFVVTGQGGGVEVPGRAYREYRLQDYSPWLRKRVQEPQYWKAVRGCILGSKTCDQLAAWTPLDYAQRDLSPVQVLLSWAGRFGFIRPRSNCAFR
ncbi:TET6 [Linum grandiflorum]